MFPGDILSYVKKAVSQDASPSQRSPKVRRPTRTKSSINSNVYRERYGISSLPVRSNSYRADPTAINRLKATLTSSLATAQQTVTRLSPTKPASSGDSEQQAEEKAVWKPWDPTNTAAVSLSENPQHGQSQDSDQSGGLSAQLSKGCSRSHSQNSFSDEVGGNTAPSSRKPSLVHGNLEIVRCKVCFKNIHDTEFFRVCTNCTHRVCDDCSSYSREETNNPEGSLWTCSICTRKKNNRNLASEEVVFAKVRPSTSSLGSCPPSPSLLKPFCISSAPPETGRKSFSVESAGSCSQALEVPSADIRRNSDGGAVLDSKKEKNSEYPSVPQSYSFEQCRTTPSIQNNSGSGKISVNISRDQVFETPRNRAHFQVGNHLAIARDAYKGMAQSETDIKKLQGDEGRDPSSVNPSTSAPGQSPWLTCPRQPVGRTKSSGEKGLSATQSFHGTESLERKSSPARKDSHEDQHGRDPALFAIMETIATNQCRMSPRASLRGTRCSPKTSQRESWNLKLGDSFSDSEPEEGLGWGRRKQERRHSFKATRSQRIDMDGYEPEEVSVCGTLDSSQSSISAEVPQLVHSRTEDWDMFHSMGQEWNSRQRRLSSVSVMSDSVAIAAIRSSHKKLSDHGINSEHLRLRSVDGDSMQDHPHPGHGEKPALYGQDSRDSSNITIVVHPVAKENKKRNKAKADPLVRDVILQIQDMSDPYRFGLRVVGVGQESPCARVLWLFPGGAAERAGITVGDKIITWGGVSLGDLSLADIPPLIEQSDRNMVVASVSHNSSPEEQPVRRKLPVPPICSPSSVPGSRRSSRTPSPKTGEMGWLQVSIELAASQLIITILTAEGLNMVENEVTLSLPSPYVVTRLTSSGVTRSYSTDVEETGRCPVWEATHVFTTNNQNELIYSVLDFTLWSYSCTECHDFLGCSSLDLSQMSLSSPGTGHQTFWLPLQSDNKTRRKSSAEECRLARLGAELVMVGGEKLPAGSMTTGRRLSDKGYEASLPSSVRNSQRRQSDFCGSEHNSSGSNNHLSLKRHNSIERSQDIALVRGQHGGQGGQDLSSSDQDISTAKLRGVGPLQLVDMDSELDNTDTGQKYPEVCLVMLINQGYLELHVLAARNIPNNPGGLPDTYVKTYLKEGERRFLKKKSRLVVANRDPFFKHRVKYLASDLPRRTLHLGIWFKTQGTVSKNSCVGVVEVAVERLKENSSIRGWYRLFRPVSGQGVESD